MSKLEEFNEYYKETFPESFNDKYIPIGPIPHPKSSIFPLNLSISKFSSRVLVPKSSLFLEKTPLSLINSKQLES